MLKISLAFTTGALIGIAGSFVALVTSAIILEESPELLEALTKR